MPSVLSGECLLACRRYKIIRRNCTFVVSSSLIRIQSSTVLDHSTIARVVGCLRCLWCDSDHLLVGIKSILASSAHRKTLKRINVRHFSLRVIALHLLLVS